jgi:hypothetical protein
VSSWLHPCRRVDPRRDSPYHGELVDAGPSLEDQAFASADQAARSTYWCLRAVLEDDGMSPVNASRVALRTTRLAFLREAGFSDVECSRLLARSERTVGTDSRRLKALSADAISDAASGRLPRVPVSGRVSVSACAAGWRRRVVS